MALLDFVYDHPSIAEIRGSPSKVLSAIDEFGRAQKFLMNVGDSKGKIVAGLIAEVKPQTMVELGGYVGYSAILFGDALRKAGGKRYFSLERSPQFAAVVMSMVNLAGLSDIVSVIVGSSADSIKRLQADGTLEHIDLLFLDHHKPLYLTDLKLCEQLRLVRPGTVLAADNVVKPGNPPYLEYVRSTVQQKRNDSSKAAEIAFGDQLKDKYPGERAAFDSDVKGNPNLIYQSELVHSFEPTGVPVCQNC